MLKRNPWKKKEHGNQDDDDVVTHFVIERHRWDLYYWIIHEDPIYGIDGEILKDEDMNLHLPFQSILGEKL
jgi:hypothetical protein